MEQKKRKPLTASVSRGGTGARKYLRFEYENKPIDSRKTKPKPTRFRRSELVERGLLVSEDLDELLELSDRILVMSDGEVVLETPIASAERNAIGRAMAGHATA